MSFLMNLLWISIDVAILSVGVNIIRFNPDSVLYYWIGWIICLIAACGLQRTRTRSSRVSPDWNDAVGKIAILNRENDRISYVLRGYDLYLEEYIEAGFSTYTESTKLASKVGSVNKKLDQLIQKLLEGKVDYIPPTDEYYKEVFDE